MTPETLLRHCGLSRRRLGRFAAQLRDEVALRHGQARRAARARHGATDLVEWGRACLPDHFAQPPNAMHRWLALQLARAARRRGARINVLAPRGSAKSTVATLAYPLCRALEGDEPYIWIVSDTRDQACTHLDNLRAELERNPRLRAAYPDAAGRGPVWRRGTLVLRNGVVIEAFGTGQRLRGRRGAVNAVANMGSNSRGDSSGAGGSDSVAACSTVLRAANNVSRSGAAGAIGCRAGWGCGGFASEDAARTGAGCGWTGAAGCTLRALRGDSDSPSRSASGVTTSGAPASVAEQFWLCGGSGPRGAATAGVVAAAREGGVPPGIAASGANSISA